MRKEIKARVEVKAETETQKVVSKGHLPHMKQKTVLVKNGLHQMNEGRIENIRLRENKNFASLYEDTKEKMLRNFKLVELSVSK